MKASTRFKAMTVVALAGLTASACSSAGVVTGAFTITARYQQTCEITVAPVLDFGTVTSNASVLYVSGTMIVNCGYNTQTPFGVWAPLSANASGTQRRMKNNNASTGNYLNYNLLLGATGSTVISSTSTTTGFTSPVGNSQAGIALRAQLPASQTLTQGYYSDDLILTVSY
jgi:spore coat protein U-like protein